MSITATLVPMITAVMKAGGYPALLLFTTLDSTVIPVPNEAVMPFAGFLIYEGFFSTPIVLLVSTIGAIVGALTSYAIGAIGAEPFVRRFGKYLRLTEKDLQKTHRIFATYGERIILVSRFIPVVRQFISIPAGAARMNILTFILYTAVGSLLWNSMILAVGYSLGANWSRIGVYTGIADKVILVILLLGIGYLLYKAYRATKQPV